MTDIFIYIIFGIIILFDIIIILRKKKSITAVFRHWYESFIFVPFTIGVIFLGHFLSLMPWEPTPLLTILVLPTAGLTMLIISIIMVLQGKTVKPRALILLVIAIGYLVGDLAW